MQREVVKRKIAIIGCGPVGMFGTLLFEHFGLDFVSIEKHPSTRAHPSAHWINASSKALFRQIPGLVQQLDKHQEEHKWEYFNCFRYVETVFGYELGVADHFLPSIEQKLRQSEFLFGEKPSHIPQNKLLKSMNAFVHKKENIMFGHQIKQIKAAYSEETKRNKFTLFNQNDQKIVEADYVVLCNGTSSKLKQNLPQPVSSFSSKGHSNILNFIGIYFTSTKLAQKILQKKCNAMLHFVYNKKIVGILVNHSVTKQGEFMLQVINFQPFVDLLQVYEPKEIIAMIFDQECPFMWDIINDICIINVGKWELSGMLTDSFYSNGVFLAGDSAHSIPPAGGFGMNTGFHDIHELAHTFLLVEKNPLADREKIFNRYSQHRWQVGLAYLKKAMENFNITKQIGKKLGLSSSPVEIFQSNSMLKSMMTSIAEKRPHYMEKIRLKTLAMIYKRKQLGRPPLELFFDDFDIFAQSPSILKHKIMKINSKYKEIHQLQKKQSKKQQEEQAKVQTEPKFFNLYAREWSLSLEQIKSYFGEIDPKSINFFSCEHGEFKLGERLIMSDGTVLIQ